MNTSFAQATVSMNPADALHRWFLAFSLGTTAEVPTDMDTLSAWLSEGHELRAEASARAEAPPLTSY